MMEEKQKITQPTGVVKKSRRGRRRVQEFLGGEYLSREWVIGNLSYLLFVTALAILYIGNTYYAEKTYKAIERTKSELKELRFRYISTKSKLMFETRPSEISKKALLYGLKESSMPPYKILYPGKRLKTKN